jgi:hypothetical protein
MEKGGDMSASIRLQGVAKDKQIRQSSNVVVKLALASLIDLRAKR